MKRFFIIVAAMCLPVMGQISLDTICLNTDFMTLMGGSGMGLPDSVTISGTCDSIAVFMPISPAIPVVTIQESGSCTLIVTFTLSSTDTTYDVCNYTSIQHAAQSSIPTASAMRITHTGDMISIEYSLAGAGGSIAIYSMTGSLVREFRDLASMSGAIQWNGTDNLGAKVGAGNFICIARTGNISSVASIILAK